MEKRIVVAGLVAGRHPLPVELYVFETVQNPTDFEGMQRVADQWVFDHCKPEVHFGVGPSQTDYTDVPMNIGTPLVLYVTGLTAALAAVVGACHRMGVPLTLMHYDSLREKYISQEVL